MNSICSLCFTAMFIGALIVHAKDEDPTMKLHKDLTNFVSEPDIKAPLFNITHYDEGTVSSGYWFMEPQDHLKPHEHLGHPTTRAELLQIGPHIFDNHGELVWSGARIFENRVSFDFKAVQVNGASHLSFILNANDVKDIDQKGVGVIMDSHYRIQQKLHMPRDSPSFDMHEFNIVEDGRSALTITSVPVWESVVGGASAWIANEGFQETDLRTNKVLFNWKSLDHIDVSTSKIRIIGSDTPENPWDWLHLNSIDKNRDGDYLVSARYTSTIYKISGRDGSIIWQLSGSGINSSFIHEGGFEFSWQHDARFHQENSTHTIISFLDNASMGKTSLTTATVSSALYIALRTDIMTATVLTKIDRPDNKQSYFRGNVQELHNNNIFICWADNGYISEFTPSGKLALEAKFVSNRFTVYRAYKFEFIGLPLDPPALKAYAFGTTADTITTVLYVSWNGATEVVDWHFYGNGMGTDFLRIGQAKKAGFETMYMVAGYQTSVYVEGIDVKGKHLGQSVVVETVVPTGLEFAGCKAAPCCIPNIGYIQPDGEDYSKHRAQAGSTSISKYRVEVYATRRVILGMLVICWVLGVISLVVLCQRWRARQATLCKEYKQV